MTNEDPSDRPDADATAGPGPCSALLVPPASPESAADAVPASGPVAEDLVEAVVKELNAICKRATFDFAMAVGRLVVDRFYDGDLTRWRVRRAKGTSFRKLARHPDLPLSPSALYRSVAIYELIVKNRIDQLSHVSTSHVRLLLPLPPDKQLQLLRAAEANRWTVARLRAEIAPGGPDDKHRVDASKPQEPLRRTIDTLRGCLDPSGRFVGSDDDVDLSPESGRSLVELLTQVRAACDLLKQRARQSLPGARTQPPPSDSSARRLGRR